MVLLLAIPNNLVWNRAVKPPNCGDLREGRFCSIVPLRSVSLPRVGCYHVPSKEFWDSGSFMASANVDDSSTSSPVPFTAQDDISRLKSDILKRVVGLDKGISATELQAKEIEEAVVALENLGPAVVLPSDLEKIKGTWSLVFSSGFLSGSLGGQRPGPPIKSPITIGQVSQRIDPSSNAFDNIVTLEIATPWPLPNLNLTATLGHTFETVGESSTQIVLEKIVIKGEENLSGFPEFTLPQLPKFGGPPPKLRSGEFATTYVDEDLRVTRGDRGELRIFVRVK